MNDGGKYELRQMSSAVKYYGQPGGLQPATDFWLTDEEYARAREAIPTWCLDGLVCAVDSHDQPVIVLAIRAGEQPPDGPFRGEPWVVGGRWDMVTPWKDFVRRRAVQELFGGKDPGFDAEGPLDNQLFATGWSAGTDGPFGRQGVTLQFCYQLTMRAPLTDGLLKPDSSHSGFLELRQGESLGRLHPYIRDVIQLSGWLK